MVVVPGSGGAGGAGGGSISGGEVRVLVVGLA